ncbi:MAG: phosphatidylglycerophosphate synthase [Candidatus Azotimanducaceae bacterium]|jgi:phosphatidylglycerophosphate synthase
MTLAMTYITIPNFLSITRLLLAPVIFFAIVHSQWQWASIIFFVAIASDLLDGYLARLWNQSSPLGGFLDHGSDAAFVTTIFVAEVYLGLIPTLLPCLVILAFTQYTLDSNTLSGHPLRTSALGRLNGIAYFVLAGAPLILAAMNLSVITPEMIKYGAYFLCLTTLVSMIDRLLTLFRYRITNK